ncbi:Rap1a/Tai family immunity protein [Castellaniella denitrificans]|uniref:Rap1a/Tai family immunity protein n=1 Tax=Castellaniella denitrificans TaxID=56119 RepID=A0ABT4M7K9_9BURK|nr:Rap1a/Tai family immunity protein [Castellaniella denitrificans]MCZ4330965.1 Rap1a/Tai family immunity protein [Castellaniella denitrificans]
MKRSQGFAAILLVFGLALSCPVASAGFVDGYQLKKWSDGSDRVQHGSKQSLDLADESYLIGYISGISDFGDGLIFCSPSNARLGQLMGVTRKHLLANPEKWNQPAAMLVVEALMQAFPCK